MSEPHPDVFHEVVRDDAGNIVGVIKPTAQPAPAPVLDIEALAEAVKGAVEAGVRAAQPLGEDLTAASWRDAANVALEVAIEVGVQAGCQFYAYGVKDGRAAAERALAPEAEKPLLRVSTHNQRPHIERQVRRALAEALDAVELVPAR